MNANGSLTALAAAVPSYKGVHEQIPSCEKVHEKIPFCRLLHKKNSICEQVQDYNRRGMEDMMK
jgi:hypothetical protein